MSKHKYIKATEDRESRNSKTRDGSSKTSKHNTNSNSIANNNTNILDETDDLQTALYEY